jgi:hypothetical protein
MTRSFAVAAAALVIAGCHHRPVLSAAPDPSLELRADGEAHAAAPDGQRMGPALWGVGFEADGFTDFKVPLEAGHCYTFGFAGDATVQRLALYIWNPHEKRLDSQRTRTPEGVLKYCTTESGMYRLQGKVGAPGHFAMVPYVGPGPAVVAVVAAAPVDLTTIIDQQAAAAAPGAARVGDYFAGNTPQSDWFIPMEVGKCYWVIGAGEAGKVKRLYLYLWDPQNRRLNESKAESTTPMLGFCPKDTPGMYKFQAKVDSGSGNYKVGVFAK